MRPRHILITGGAGAIGSALAAEFRRHHPRVAITLVDRDELGLRGRANELSAAAEVCDLTDIPSLPTWWRAIAARRGDVDVLVNCAGVMEILSVTATGWARGLSLLEINLLAPLRLMDLALPAMIEAGRGCVINVASMAGRVPLRGCSYYGAAKAAIGLASEVARLDVKERGVDVITVYPGPIYSGLERHARGQVRRGLVSRWIPTGTPEALARRVYAAFRTGDARVVGPRVYQLADQLAGLGLTRRVVGLLSPRPNE